VAAVVLEEDGLALSSRNVYLDPDERSRALSLYRGLAAAVAAFRAGERDAEVLKAEVRRALTADGARPEYVELVDAATLEPLEVAESGAALAVAALLGRTRLIDNVILR
jgi:pantoate--beta-alanine ligase